MAPLAPEQDPEVWDELAEGYAKYLDPMTGAYVDHLLQIAGPSPDEQVLDVACGAGAVALPAARKGAKVLAVDIAPKFVQIVTARAHQEGLQNLEARVMDAMAMDLPDASFDVALSNFGLFLLPDRRKGFQEVHRVLKSGGRLVTTSFVAPPENQWVGFFRESLQRAFPEITPKPPQFLELADPERFRRELEEAGFDRVEVETRTKSVTWSTVDDAWAGLAETAPVFRPLMEKIGEDGRKRLRGEFQALATERFGEQAPVTLSTPAHFARAHKG